jgi:hypothetical protein
MVLFGKTREDFLKEFTDLSDGIPSHETFNRVISTIGPELLRQCPNSYGKDMAGELSEKQICLDGKKRRGVSPLSR